MADPPRQSEPTRVWSGVTAVLAAALSLTVYVGTLASGVTGEDSGELIAAAYTLGVPHPPGYPLWCLLAHVFTCLPGASVAWKVNLSSAVFAAGAVGVTTLFLSRMTRAPWLALGGGLLLAFSHEFWEQAIIAEVYALNAFFLSVCLLWLQRWHETKQDRFLWFFAITFGLSLGNHNTMHLLGPLFGIFILCTDKHPLHRIRTYAALLCTALVIGFALYLYLPLRSLADPPVDWGNPETLSAWWDHVRRAQYAFMFDQYPRSLGRFGRQVGTMSALLWQQWPWWISFLLVPWTALGLLARPGRPMRLLLGAIAVTVLAGFAFIQNFNYDKEWLWVMSVFLLPVNLAVVALAVLGGARGERPGTRMAFTGITLLLALATVTGNAPEPNRRDDTVVPDYVTDIMAEIPPDAIFVPQADHVAFPLLYYQVVEGRYKRVLLARKYGYLDTTALSTIVPGLLEQYGPSPPRLLEPEILQQVYQTTDRPLVFTQASASLMRGKVYQHGLTWNTVPPTEPPLHRLPLIGPLGRPGRDYTREAIAAERALARAEACFASGDKESGRQAVEHAIRAFGKDAPFLVNVGVLCARHGEYRLAYGYWREALAKDPTLEAARNNLERLDEKTRGEH